MSKPKPLYIRLYRDPHLMALVRLIGYRDVPVPEVKEQLRPLVERYGKEMMQAAAQEVVQIDTAQDPPVARLTPAARRLAWQLLGPPAEAG